MTQTEFSRVLDVASLQDRQVVEERLEADAAERRALAARFGIAGLDVLVARVAAVRHGRQIRAEIALVAQAVQTCVVSLDPIAVCIEETFEMTFDPDVRPTGEFDEPVDLDPEGDDPPEPMVDERIDLGEAVAERFGLALDPYPRKRGAVLDAAWTVDGTGTGEAGESPFATLKNLEFGD